MKRTKGGRRPSSRVGAPIPQPAGNCRIPFYPTMMQGVKSGTTKKWCFRRPYRKPVKPTSGILMFKIGHAPEPPSPSFLWECGSILRPNSEHSLPGEFFLHDV